ncbi:hypothetical protein ARC20_03300 [Stenotrophomonas panacihumi]|uniref:Uncharacterized protein n=1 Tax=Stenotrophomonas panacihumi TaxID=676599 RepID=A0A0R0B2H8_9GAMM|nr:hypothetical protein [Stenotrophomonas panacihumi]KRG47368.1 hypothetical protein ARC20_03300 [Stenotrophomonas panacihumi]PTN55846.1 hypothetical protein C9J98_04540 [Stenotrophomonas panacihumi]
MTADLTAADIAREGSIRRIANEMRVEHLLENESERRRLWEQMREKSLARSQAQVERMEQAGGLQP